MPRDANGPGAGDAGPRKTRTIDAATTTGTLATAQGVPADRERAAAEASMTTKTIRQVANLHVTVSRFGYRGIEWYRDKGKFRARIDPKGQRQSLGYFHTAQEAASAYDDAARHVYGQHAALNFPIDGERC